MLSNSRKQFGQKGEDSACAYLAKHKYKIIERNFRTRNGEIDIIAIDTSENPPTLVFIEVKTRFSNAFGEPLESIGFYKLKALERTAIFYQASHPNLPGNMRLDAVAVSMDYDGTVKNIQLIKNIS